LLIFTITYADHSDFDHSVDAADHFADSAGHYCSADPAGVVDHFADSAGLVDCSADLVDHFADSVGPVDVVDHFAYFVDLTF